LGFVDQYRTWIKSTYDPRYSYWVLWVSSWVDPAWHLHPDSRAQMAHPTKKIYASRRRKRSEASGVLPTRPLCLPDPNRIRPHCQPHDIPPVHAQHHRVASLSLSACFTGWTPRLRQRVPAAGRSLRFRSQTMSRNPGCTVFIGEISAALPPPPAPLLFDRVVDR
jgi:hypothetical protein